MVHQNGHVHVVDDEVLVAMTVAHALEEHGFRVTITHDGLQALEAEAKEPSDLLVTDMRMPRLDGAQLIQRLRPTRPELPIVVMTGYSETLPAPDPGRLVIVRKPFDADRLLDAVHGLLGGSTRQAN